MSPTTQPEPTMHIKTIPPEVRAYASYERLPQPTTEQISIETVFRLVNAKLHANPGMTKREAVNAVLRDVVNLRNFEIEDGLWLLSNLFQHWAIKSKAKRVRKSPSA